MKKTLLTATLVAILAGGTALAGPGGMRADSDGNGAISRAEFTAKLDARFAKLDTDNNGSVTAAESSTARDAMRDKRAKRMEARGKTMTERAGGKGNRFAKMDANGDGALSIEEHRAIALTRFDRMDGNRDGQIDKAERQALRDKMKERRAARQG